MKKLLLLLLISVFCFSLAFCVQTSKNHKNKLIKSTNLLTNNNSSAILANENEKKYEFITKTFPLNFIEPQIMAEKIKLYFSSVTVICDSDTNSLSVSAYSINFSSISNMITLDDVKEEVVDVKITLLELSNNYVLNESTTSDYPYVFLSKQELSNIFKLDLNGKAKKIYESGNFTAPYNSTTTIVFKTNYSAKNSGLLEINLLPVTISTQNAQLNTSVNLSIYSQDTSTVSQTNAIIEFDKNKQYSVLVNNVITTNARNIAYLLPFMSDIIEVGQLFNKDSVLEQNSNVVLIIQMFGNNNE